jgi:glycosyltransferase involved in cell wall biosynthesis
MKISYLVTCSNETDTLKRLLETVVANLGNDQLVILQDGNNTSTEQVLDHYRTAYDYYNTNISFYKHSLNNDYGSHKNFGVEHCTGDYIFQCDGDEMPPEALLGENLHSLIEGNPTVEAYVIPRINAWHGLTAEHAQKWGWTLDMSPTYNRVRAAWPDYQWRLFKNDPKIRFHKKLHERIEGFEKYVVLPADEDYAIYHDKTIETQIATNERYNKDFTQAENRGVSSPVK